ncbi:hypothetical protein DM01DRAFT_93904 [Hesseltinella vesiculosa]|uniref:Uncharacterized protein n=1 Tax=Hesseltinella vesiculosa TaxID=101127 RepID=A0A1X2G3I5_9FUNG|nr:hypothetical protein DM01DRAFT_93904 [Hesseltinella vesiculosa]
MVTFLFPELKRRSKSFGDLKKGQVYDHQPYRHSMFFPSALTTRPTHAPLQQSFKRFVSEPAFPTLHVSIDPCQDQLYPLALTSPPDSTTSNNTDAASSTVQKVSPTNLLTNDSTVNDVIANAPFSPLPPADNNVQIFDVLDNPSPAFIHYSQRSAKPNTTIISVTVEKLVEIMTKDMGNFSSKLPINLVLETA